MFHWYLLWHMCVQMMCRWCEDDMQMTCVSAYNMQMTPGVVLHKIGQLRQVSGWHSGWHMSSTSQISPEVSLSCHPHIICTSSARRPHKISTGNIFPLKEQTALLIKTLKSKRLLWDLNSEPTDHQSAAIVTSLKSQVWVGNRKAFSNLHAWLNLVEFNQFT